MKKFNIFLLTALTLLFTSIQANALTTSSSITTTFHLQVDNPNLLHLDNLQFIATEVGNGVEVSESLLSEFIANNTTLLYSICVVLVLVNLIAQVKIILQMVDLFFQFQKKDEFASFKFQ